MQDFLITEENLKIMLNNHDDKDYNVKKLLNNYNLTQSQSIKFGKVFENFIGNILEAYGYKLIELDFAQISRYGKIKLKELDICCMSPKLDVMYFESKINLNLDSEKSKVTDEKVKMITQYLKNKYQGHNVIGRIITCCYQKEDGLRVTPNTKIVFMEEFLRKIGIEMSREEYYSQMALFGQYVSKVNNK